jgi:transcriptional regulator NrdR family protein
MRGFKCEFCGYENTEVVTTIPLFTSVLRIRSCLRCGMAFETVETVHNVLDRQISKYHKTPETTETKTDQQASLVEG